MAFGRREIATGDVVRNRALRIPPFSGSEFLDLKRLNEPVRAGLMGDSAQATASTWHVIATGVVGQLRPISSLSDIVLGTAP